MHTIIKSLYVLTLVGCGTAHNSKDQGTTQPAATTQTAPAATKTTKVFALETDLPECTVDLQGQPVLIEATGAYKTCQNGSWVLPSSPAPVVAATPDVAPTPATPVVADEETSKEPVVVAPVIPPEPVLDFINDESFKVCVIGPVGTPLEGVTKLLVTKEYVVPGPQGAEYYSPMIQLFGSVTHKTDGIKMDDWDNQTALNLILSIYGFKVADSCK